jgi:hypothetical protein
MYNSMAYNLNIMYNIRDQISDIHWKHFIDPESVNKIQPLGKGERFLLPFF